MRTLCLIVISVCCLSGCAKIAHLQELLTLKAYSENQDQKASYVEKRDAQFRKLVEAARETDMREFENQKLILKSFGEPIFKRNIRRDTAVYEQWMYRYQTKLTGSEKVYLYFDPQGKLSDKEYVPAAE